MILFNKDISSRKHFISSFVILSLELSTPALSDELRVCCQRCARRLLVYPAYPDNLAHALCFKMAYLNHHTLLLNPPWNSQLPTHSFLSRQSSQDTSPPTNRPCRASVVRYPNGTFEARIHLPGAATHIDVVPHENFILVTGSLATRARVDSDDKPSNLAFTDQPCGVFGRDIPVNLTAGTEVVSLFIFSSPNSLEPSSSSFPLTKTVTTMSSATRSATPSRPAPTALILSTPPRARPLSSLPPWV